MRAPRREARARWAAGGRVEGRGRRARCSCVGPPIIVAPAMAWLDRDGVRLYYEVHEGPADALPLLLSHGFSASAAMWSTNAPALAERRHVLAWDMRGHARSDAPADQALYSHERGVGATVRGGHAGGRCRSGCCRRRRARAGAVGRPAGGERRLALRGELLEA